jgi:hypothetical protein
MFDCHKMLSKAKERAILMMTPKHLPVEGEVAQFV